MADYFCRACGKQLPKDIIAIRHYSQADLERPMFCDRKCRVDYDQQTGHFTRMSASRGEGWLEALRKSNQSKPRRRR